MVDDMKGGKVMKSGKIMTLIFLFLTSLCIRADQLTWIDRARIVYDRENYGEFCFWAEKAQDKPLFVLNALAAVYLTGKGGVQTNSEKAVSFLNDAIKFWDKEGLSEEDRKILLESTVRLGDCYRRGIGVGRIDALKAAEMFKKAADQKSACACYELGSCYEENIVPEVSDNLASATNWYFKAMSLGHGPAATNAYERVVKRIKEREVIALNRNIEKDFRERKSDKKKSEGVVSAETTFTSKNESVWQGVWKGCKVLACSPGEILRFPVNHWGEITTAAVREMDDDQIGILGFPIIAVIAVDGAACVTVGGVSFVGDCCLGLSDILSGGYLGNRFYYNKDSWGLTPVFQRKWEW